MPYYYNLRRDSQRSRCYNWEQEILAALPLHFELSFWGYAEDMVSYVQDTFGLPSAPVLRRGTRQASYWHKRAWAIVLSPGACMHTVAHECAHWVADEMYGPDKQAHGARFMCVRMAIGVLATGLVLDWQVDLANALRLRFCSPSALLDRLPRKPFYLAAQAATKARGTVVRGSETMWDLAGRRIGQCLSKQPN